MPTQKNTAKKITKQGASVLRCSGFDDFINYLDSPWKIIWTNFLAGIFRGLGIIIGMTLVFGIILWMLSHLVNFPLIGQYFAEIKTILEGFQSFNLRNQ